MLPGFSLKSLARVGVLGIVGAAAFWGGQASAQSAGDGMFVRSSGCDIWYVSGGQRVGVPVSSLPDAQIAALPISKFWLVSTGPSSLGFGDQPGVSDTSAPAAEVPAAPAPADVSEAQPPIELRGHGNQATARFSLQEGLVVPIITHNGRSNVKMFLLDSNGVEKELIVNEIGPIDMIRAFPLKASGQYLVKVEADGDWTLTLTEPRPSAAPAAPQSFQGSGTRLSGFFALPGGLVTVQGTYQMADRNRVIIRLRNANGQIVEQIANQVENFNGSTAVRTDPGIYFFEMFGAGNWSVGIQ